jgi:hypothetical protein
MLKADSVLSTPPLNTSSRRKFLAQVAAAVASGAAIGAALPLPNSATASELAPDPIFHAIEVHKAAYARLGNAIDRQAKLDLELPRDKCQTCLSIWNQTVVDTDDPRWIEVEQEVWAAYEAGETAARALVSIRPTTAQGVHALLTYALAHDTDGMAWPAELESDEKPTRTWYYYLIENVLVAMTLGLGDRSEGVPCA